MNSLCIRHITQSPGVRREMQLMVLTDELLSVSFRTLEQERSEN